MNETIKPSEHRDVDQLLRGYFRAQMPDPWPTCPEVAEVVPLRTPARWLSGSRLALAASLLLFFLGYFALSSYFPRDHAKPFPGDHRQDIGQRMKHK